MEKGVEQAMDNNEIPLEAIDWDSMKIDAERRQAVRQPVNFFAVQRRGSDEYYRLVTNLSPTGFFFEDRVPAEQIGEMIVMDFPLPDEGEPVRVTGRVRYVDKSSGVGVEITHVREDKYAKLIALPPPVPPKKR